MAKYAISEAGVRCLEELANCLLTTIEDVEVQNKVLQHSIMASMNELGIYGIEIWEIFLKTKENVERSKEDICGLAERIKEKANDISQLMFFTSGGISGVEPMKQNQRDAYIVGTSGGGSLDVEALLRKQRLSAEDRANIRNAVMLGKIDEQDICKFGSKVRNKYDEIIMERNREYDYLQEKRRELAKRVHYASTPEEESEIADEVRKLREREERYKAKYSGAPIVKQVLESFRDIGPESGDGGQQYDRGFFSSSSSVIEAINSIREYLPTDWVNTSNKVPIITKHVTRGYFNMKGGQPVIALSGSESGMQRCAFHEMGHFFEEMYPEIRKLEYQFYNRRTAGEELRWLGWGYDRSEVTRYDNFIEPYMGKDYGNTETSGFEIFSMGMESVFAGSYNLSRDTDYQDFILGILVSI